MGRAAGRDAGEYAGEEESASILEGKKNLKYWESRCSEVKTQVQIVGEREPELVQLQSWRVWNTLLNPSDRSRGIMGLAGNVFTLGMGHLLGVRARENPEFNWWVEIPKLP